MYEKNFNTSSEEVPIPFEVSVFKRAKKIFSGIFQENLKKPALNPNTPVFTFLISIHFHESQPQIGIQQMSDCWASALERINE